MPKEIAIIEDQTDLCPQGVEVFRKKNDTMNLNLKYSLTIFLLQVT